VLATFPPFNDQSKSLARKKRKLRKKKAATAAKKKTNPTVAICVGFRTQSAPSGTEMQSTAVPNNGPPLDEI